MQTDETIDRYFYITGWICIAIFAALAAVIGVCGTQILTKVPPLPAARIYRILLSGVRWHESHICVAARTSDKVVCTPSVCAVYSRFGRLVYAVTDTAADKLRQAAYWNALQTIIYVACTCHYCGKLYSQKYAYIILRYSSAEVAHCSRYRSGSGIPLIYPLCFRIREAWRQTNRYR